MMVGSLRVCDIKIILTSFSDSKLQKYNMQGGGGGAATRSIDTANVHACIWKMQIT